MAQVQIDILASIVNHLTNKVKDNISLVLIHNDIVVGQQRLCDFQNIQE